MENLSHIEALNRRFGVANVTQVVSGEGGFPIVRITSPLASAEISLYGAQVLSWKPAGAEEVIFLSKRSRWEPGQAIRGGIPVCFPWFREKADDPKAPKHGFVRTREWRLDSLRADEDGSVTLLCVTSNDDHTRRLWPHDFLLAYRMRIADTLRLELSVMNRGITPFRFEEALHTYFRVGQVQQARAAGLDGAVYLDNIDGNRPKRQSGDLTIAAPTDNAYMDTESAVAVVDPVLHRRLRTEKLHSCATVVWNPWEQAATSLPDLGEEWQNMLCVEAANILTAAVSLGPGEEHTMRATIFVLPESTADKDTEP